MIKRFTCENFRNISCTALEFDRINILIGPNNAGKSNFIRALSFAANMVSNAKNETTCFLSEIKRNGWNTSANRRDEHSDFKLVWHFNLETLPVKYTLHAHVGKKRDENYIVEESLDSAELREGAEKPYNFFQCHTPKAGRGKFSTAGMTSQKNKRLYADVDQYESVLLQMDSVAFRRFVNQSILTAHYKASVEEYGYFDGEYKKLSEEIQKSLDNIDFLENYKPDDTHYKPRYSKRIHGETMLQLLDPSQVAQHCTLFFKNGLLQLQALAE